VYESSFEPVYSFSIKRDVFYEKSKKNTTGTINRFTEEYVILVNLKGEKWGKPIVDLTGSSIRVERIDNDLREDQGFRRPVSLSRS
jgi:hypothetical protein